MNNIYDDTMNNNEPDYEGNLAFPPQEESVEKKCEKLEKQLKIAIEAINKGLTSNYILQADVREDMDLYAPLYDKSPERKEFERQERALSKALEKIKELDK